MTDDEIEIIQDESPIPLYDENGCCSFCGCPKGTCSSEYCTCTMCEKVNYNDDTWSDGIYDPDCLA